jgi:hypothetical protein
VLILKERIFGLTGNEGNHGEDVKEYYLRPRQSKLGLTKYSQASNVFAKTVPCWPIRSCTPVRTRNGLSSHQRVVSEALASWLLSEV